MQKSNTKLANAVAILNRIEPSKLSTIVTRVLANNTNNVSVLFEEREVEKLLKVFGISEQDLVSLVQALHFVFMQAAFERNFKPVEANLKAHGIKLEQLASLQEIWTENGGDYVNKVKDKPVSIEKSLTGISWNLTVPYKENTLPIIQKVDLLPEGEKPNIITESIYSDDARNPVAIVNFEVKQNDASDSQTKGSTKTVSIQMTKGNVQKFFEQLEIIQAQLDDLL